MKIYPSTDSEGIIYGSFEEAPKGKICSLCADPTKNYEGCECQVEYEQDLERWQSSRIQFEDQVKIKLGIARHYVYVLKRKLKEITELISSSNTILPPIELEVEKLELCGNACSSPCGEGGTCESPSKFLLRIKEQSTKGGNLKTRGQATTEQINLWKV